MINRVICIVFVFGLSACSAPQSENKDAKAHSDLVLAEPMVEAVSIPADKVCKDPEDGLGGTGCSVD